MARSGLPPGPGNAQPTTAPRRRHPRYSRAETVSAYGMLLPGLVGTIMFSLLPIGLAVHSSFYDSGFYQAPNFVGFNNFLKVLRDRYFSQAILVGLRYTLYVVPLLIVLSFAFANLIKRLTGRFAGFVKTTIFVPNVISGVIASFMFVYIFDYQAGILNSMLKLFGIGAQPWLQNPTLALIAMAAPRIWLAFGWTTLLMLGGLLDIPETYYESATIDGAGRFKQMVYITIPSMRNTLLFVLVSNVIGMMQEFDLPYNMTRGGPASATTTPNLYVYTHFVRDQTVGFSISAALLIAIVLGGLSTLIFRLVSSEKSYE